MSFEAAVHAKAIQLDHLCLDMCATAGSGHPSSGMSLGHLVTVLLYHSMRWLPEHPRYPMSYSQRRPPSPDRQSPLRPGSLLPPGPRSPSVYL